MAKKKPLGRIPRHWEKVQDYLLRAGVPYEILDYLDLYSEWDETLEPDEALDVLVEAHPELKQYLPQYREKLEDKVFEHVQSFLNEYYDAYSNPDPTDLKNLLNNVMNRYYIARTKEGEEKRKALSELYYLIGVDVADVEELNPFIIDLVEEIFDNIVEGRYFLEDYDYYPDRTAAIKAYIKYKGGFTELSKAFRRPRRTPVTDTSVREYAINAVRFGSVGAFEKYLKDNFPRAEDRIKGVGFKSISEFYKKAIKSKRIQNWARYRTQKKREEIIQRVTNPEVDKYLKIAFAELGFEYISTMGHIEITEDDKVSYYRIIAIKDEESGLPVEILYPVPDHIPSGFFMGEVKNKRDGVFGFPVRNSQADYIPKYWMSEDAWRGMLIYISRTIDETVEKLKRDENLPKEIRKVFITDESMRKVLNIIEWLRTEAKGMYEMADKGDLIHPYYELKEVYNRLYNELYPITSVKTPMSSNDLKILWDMFSERLKKDGLIPVNYRDDFLKATQEGNLEDAKQSLEDIMTSLITNKLFSMEYESPGKYLRKKKWEKLIVGAFAEIDMQSQKLMGIKKKIESEEIDQMVGYNEAVQILDNVAKNAKDLIQYYLLNKDVRRLEY